MLSEELQAGPDLDISIGNIVELGLFNYRGLGGCYAATLEKWRTAKSFKGMPACLGWGEVKWSPSTDLNAAFEAADRVKLFDRGSIILDKLTPISGDPEWQVCRLTCGGCDYEVLGSGPTPAIAICRAIVKLAEAKQEAQ